MWGLAIVSARAPELLTLGLGADLEQQNLVVSVVSVVRDREQLPAKTTETTKTTAKKWKQPQKQRKQRRKQPKQPKQWACCFWPVSPVVFVVLWTPLF